MSVMPTARQLVKRASTAVDTVLPPPAGVTVLIYHRVGGGSDSAVDLDADGFERQLEHLVAHHRVITLDDAAQALGAHTPGGWAASGADTADEAEPERTVVVTFDDGTADFVDVALPILARHGVPATLYVATRFVDEGVDFPWGAPPATWSGLRESIDSGLVTIGSHTHSHGLLDRLPVDEAGADLDRSIELIGEHLGVSADHFAYPKALPPAPSAEVEVRRRFTTAALASSRVNRPGRTDLHRLARTPIQRTDSDDLFAAKARGGLRLEGEIRSLLAKFRYRDAVT